MLRNIPNRMKVVALQQHMCDLGFGDTYDFLYMPFDLRSQQNKGYAFVNLVTESVAMDFKKRFNGTKFEGRLSSKEVLVCNAATQGVAENLRSITHCNWLKHEQMPVVKWEGHLICMPPRAALEMLRTPALADAFCPAQSHRLTTKKEQIKGRVKRKAAPKKKVVAPMPLQRSWP